MVWQCIGPQQEVKSRPRQISRAANQMSDEGKPVDYSTAFKLENDRKNKRIVSFSFEIKRFFFLRKIFVFKMLNIQHAKK